jgi:hypothetical protein
MKMSPATYAKLRAAIEPRLAPIRFAPAVLRQRWDILWAAVDAGEFDMKEAYREGLNDDHIDTALRRIID